MSKQPAAPSLQTLKAEAKQALLRRNFGMARSILDEAIDMQPSSYKLHRLRSVASACLGDYEAALDDAEMVISLMPTLTDGFYHKGFALFHLKDYSGAAAAFSEGLALCPHDKVLRQGFWDALSLLGQQQALQPPGLTQHQQQLANMLPIPAGASVPWS